MFTPPREVDLDSPAEGTCDENPIYLSGVTEFEFETLIRYFYNRFGESIPASRPETQLTKPFPLPSPPTALRATAG